MGFSGPLFLNFVVSTGNNILINCQMTGFEPQTSGTGDNRSANSATATALFAFVFVLTS